MSYRHWLIPLTVVLTVAVPVRGQEPPPGPFAPGKTFYQTHTTVTRQIMVLQGQETAQTQTQTFQASWTALKRDGDTWQIKYRITGVDMKFNIGGNDTDGGPLRKLTDAFVGCELTLTVNDRLEVLRVAGVEDFLKKLEKDLPEFKDTFKAMFNESAVKQLVDPVNVMLPSSLTHQGNPWRRATTVDVGPIGKYRIDTRYVRKGREGDVLVIGTEMSVTYEPPDPKAPAGNLPFTVSKADLKSTKSSGEIRYDAKKGRVASSAVTVEMAGNMTVNIGGQDMEITLRQTQETTVRTSDTDPLKK